MPPNKNPRTGVFIDFSNLFWAIKRTDPKTGARLNYDICYIKLRQFLKSQHKPTFYNVYVCQDRNPKTEPYITRAAKMAKFVNFLRGTGYTIVDKDLKIIGHETKCDTDVEITMDLHKHVNDLDNIVVFTGDSDFVSAVKHFQSVGKNIHIYSFKSSLAWELKTLAMQTPRVSFTLLDNLRDVLEK